jgi:hypothetical protein
MKLLISKVEYKKIIYIFKVSKLLLFLLSTLKKYYRIKIVKILILYYKEKYKDILLLYIIIIIDI